MKRLILLLMVATVVLWTAGTVWATDYDFVDTGDGLWTTLANWQVAGLTATQLPTATDWVKISNKSSLNENATIGAGVSAVAGRTHIGYTGVKTLNIMSGGSLTMVYSSSSADGDMLLGKNSGDGILNMAGTLTCRDLEVGQSSGKTGTLNMTGGLITVADDFEIAQIAGSTGIVHLDGGTIILNNSFEGDSQLRMYTGGSLIFGGDGSGILKIFGDQKSKVEGYRDVNLWITTTVTGGTVAVDYNNLNPGYTTVYVIPEPATMVLLSLGGLLLRKRR